MKLVAPFRGFTVLVTHSPTLPTDIRIRPGIFLAFTLLASYEHKRRGWKGKQETNEWRTEGESEGAGKSVHGRTKTRKKGDQEKRSHTNVRSASSFHSFSVSPPRNWERIISTPLPRAERDEERRGRRRWEGRGRKTESREDSLVLFFLTLLLFLLNFFFFLLISWY